MNNNMQDTKWSESVMVVDADYVDRVAFDLIVNFERMLGRPIPQADLARWIDCVALDGGLRPGDNETQVILLHSKQQTAMANFHPSDYEAALNGQAFRDQLGEFLISAVPTGEIVDSTQQFVDTLELVCQQQAVKRIMVIPNADDADIYNKVRVSLRQVDESKIVTVFAMQPMTGGAFRQEILGYSLMAALGISSDEINSKSNQS